MTPTAKTRLRIVAALALALPGAALADRHCAPAQEEFFDGRLKILEGGDCAATLDAVAADLQAAVDWAGICTCPDLVDKMRALLATAGDTSLSCEARLEAILAETDAVEATVDACYR